MPFDENKSGVLGGGERQLWILGRRGGLSVELIMNQLEKYGLKGRRTPFFFFLLWISKRACKDPNASSAPNHRLHP